MVTIIMITVTIITLTNDVVDFNIKYKSKIVRLFEDEVIKCENNIDTYLSLLKDVKSFVEGMEEDDVRFDVVG